MTAAELKERSIRYGMKKESGKYIQIIQKYVFTPDEMQAFIDHACEEQREKCANSIVGIAVTHRWFDIDVIINAPKPEGL